MMNLDNGALPPQPLRPAAPRSVAARLGCVLPLLGGAAWARIAIEAVGKIGTDTGRFDYYPSSGVVVYHATDTWQLWTVGVGLLAAVLLLSGAAMLAKRMRTSRLLIVVGCGVVTAYSAVSIAAEVRTRSQPVHNALPHPLEFSVLVVVCALVTVACVLAPSTRRWLAGTGPATSD
jgi:hypothetical protein